MAAVATRPDGRRRQADGVRVPRRRRDRRDAEHGARRDGRPARPLPGAGRRRPATPAELAERTGTDERYVREWLNAQAAGGYVDYDPATGRYTLPPEQAVALTDEASPALPARVLPARARVGRTTRRASPRRPAAATGSAGTSTTTTSSRAASASSGPATTPTWSPTGCRRSTASWRSSSAAPRVADVGCGHGASTILMAEAFPSSTFVGSDYHRGVDRDARATRAAEAGVADRVRFEVAPAEELHRATATTWSPSSTACTTWATRSARPATSATRSRRTAPG